MTKATHYLWLDLETTGLSDAHDEILEVACIFTDARLAELDRCECLIRPTAAGWERLRMNSFVFEMHAATGLLVDCMRGDKIIKHADWQAFDMINRHAPKESNEKPNIRIAGSAVSHFDFAFVKKWMPTTTSLLDWRPFDVGQMEEWFVHCGLPTYDDVYPGEKDRKTHRAMDDIAYHLDEARWYVSRLSA